MSKWVRCRDRDTGHEYDLSEDDPRVRRGRVTVLRDYPENTRDSARPAKYRVRKNGKATSPPTL